MEIKPAMLDGLYSRISALERENDKLKAKLCKERSLVTISRVVIGIGKDAVEALHKSKLLELPEIRRMRDTLHRLSQGPHIWVDPTMNAIRESRPPRNMLHLQWKRYSFNPEGHSGRGTSGFCRW